LADGFVNYGFKAAADLKLRKIDHRERATVFICDGIAKHE
jgi:hypothetical protein